MRCVVTAPHLRLQTYAFCTFFSVFSCSVYICYFIKFASHFWSRHISYFRRVHFMPFFLLFGMASSTVVFLSPLSLCFSRRSRHIILQVSWFCPSFCLFYLYFVLLSCSVYLTHLRTFAFSEALVKVRVSWFVDFDYKVSFMDNENAREAWW